MRIVTIHDICVFIKMRILYNECMRIVCLFQFPSKYILSVSGIYLG